VVTEKGVDQDYLVPRGSNCDTKLIQPGHTSGTEKGAEPPDPAREKQRLRPVPVYGR
jgi:hypothetical protein